GLSTYVASVFLLRLRRPPSSPLFPYTTLFRSRRGARRGTGGEDHRPHGAEAPRRPRGCGARLRVLRHRGAVCHGPGSRGGWGSRSEEHTSELQSRGHLVCRLLLEKKNLNDIPY